MLTPDQQLHSMFLQFTSSTWKSTCTVASDKMHPNTKYSNYPATASTPMKQAWWTRVAVLGHIQAQRTHHGRYIAKHLHQSLHSNVMYTSDRYSVWKGSQERMEKGRVHPTPAGSQLSLPARSHMKRSSPKSGYQVQKCQAPSDLNPSHCWEGAEQSWWVVPPPLLP